MKQFQKIIKYIAIAFGLYLSISIISAIVCGVLALCTGIYGVSVLTGETSVERVDMTKEVGEFSTLKLDIVATNLTIKTGGEQYKVETYQIPQTTKIENEEGTLIIKDTKKFGNYNQSSITIYIPEGTELNDIKLEMGAGTVNIEMIKANKVDFSFGAGSVKIKNLGAENSKIECGAGKVIMENVDLNNTKIEIGAGKLECSGMLRGNTKIDCRVGEVTLNLEGGKEIYTIEAEKGIGSIKVNGNSVANESITGDGENKISIDGGIGNIEVNME